MAIWQYSFHIVPKEAFKKINPHTLNGMDLFDSAKFWGKDYNEVDLHKIDEILKKEKSWSSDIIMYGTENSNVFYIIKEESLICDINFRVDFRKNFEPFLKAIIDFCMLNGLVILDENLQEIPLNETSIKATVESSNQFLNYKFLQSKKEI